MNPSHRWIGIVAILLLVGCGASGPRRHALSGEVNYDGHPVVYGLIYFDPDRSVGHSGPQGAGEIRDGEYHTNPDYGPVPGPHIVRITGWTSTESSDGMRGPPAVSDYRITVDVPAEDAVLDFDIPAVKKP